MLRMTTYKNFLGGDEIVPSGEVLKPDAKIVLVGI